MILDTNAISAFLAGDTNVEEVAPEAVLIAIPVIVLGEYRYGLLRSNSRERIERALSGLLATSQILPVDEESTHHYALVRSELRQAGTPIPENDVWIAALARQHELPVLSRDAHLDAVRRLRRISW